VRKLLKAHQSGRQDNHKLLFSLVMFEQWLRGIRSTQSPNGRDLSINEQAVAASALR
jgi:hypothetical protein